MKCVKEVLGKGRLTTYSGGAKRAHAQGQAEKLLVKGLKVLEVRAEDLSSGAKGMVEKQALAWWLCRRTTVSRRWVSERLGMGDESRVTQSIRHMKGNASFELKKLKQLLVLEEASNGED